MSHHSRIQKIVKTMQHLPFCISEIHSRYELVLAGLEVLYRYSTEYFVGAKKDLQLQLFPILYADLLVLEEM